MIVEMIHCLDKICHSNGIRFSWRFSRCGPSWIDVTFYVMPYDEFD